MTRPDHGPRTILTGLVAGPGGIPGATARRERQRDQMRREPGEEVSFLELLTLPSAPFWARRHTRAALQAWRMHSDTIETAELLVSELVTNAINAAAPRPGNIERVCFTLRVRADRIVIEVTDSNLSPPVITDASGDAESGRGLILVQALSKDWGHYLPPSGGKTVYAIIGA